MVLNRSNHQRIMTFYLYRGKELWFHEMDLFFLENVHVVENPSFQPMFCKLNAFESPAYKRYLIVISSFAFRNCQIFFASAWDAFLSHKYPNYGSSNCTLYSQNKAGNYV